MGMKVLFAVLVLSVIVNCKDYYGRGSRMPEYSRMKKVKYYSNPPNRSYRKPPPPSPNYAESEDSPPRPANFRPKVSTSKWPGNDGLGDEDINNFVKYLSKQDLDKIIDFAGGKYSSKKMPDKTDDTSIYRVPARVIDTDPKFSIEGPFISGNKEPFNYEMEYSDVSKLPTEIAGNVFQSTDNTVDQFEFKGSYVNGNNQNTLLQDYQSPEVVNSHDFVIPSQTQETVNSDQFPTISSFIQQELNGAASNEVINTFTDSKMMREEQLPKPVNLREDVYEASNTDNVPNIVRPDLYKYKLENFGRLPLMDYDSKRDTVSSYHVPHYSVVSPYQSPPPPSSYGPSPGIKTPPLEPAPPASAAKQQSDAHLKATRIWSHLSKGTAYTLHDDGSLSLEKPGRPSGTYGYP